MLYLQPWWPPPFSILTKFQFQSDFSSHRLSTKKHCILLRKWKMVGKQLTGVLHWCINGRKPEQKTIDGLWHNWLLACITFKNQTERCIKQLQGILVITVIICYVHVTSHCVSLQPLCLYVILKCVVFNSRTDQCWNRVSVLSHVQNELHGYCRDFHFFSFICSIYSFYPIYTNKFQSWKLQVIY